MARTGLQFDPCSAQQDTRFTSWALRRTTEHASHAGAAAAEAGRDRGRQCVYRDFTIPLYGF